MRDSYPNWSKSTTSNNQDWEEKILEREATVTTKAEERKATPIYSGVLKYFTKAIAEVAKASYQGQIQHNDGQPMNWDRSKSGDELDALMRHLLDRASGEVFDTDGIRHSAKVAWRALANLEKELENERS